MALAPHPHPPLPLMANVMKNFHFFWNPSQIWNCGPNKLYINSLIGKNVIAVLRGKKVGNTDMTGAQMLKVHSKRLKLKQNLLQSSSFQHSTKTILFAIFTTIAETWNKLIQASNKEVFNIFCDHPCNSNIRTEYSRELLLPNKYVFFVSDKFFLFQSAPDFFKSLLLVAFSGHSH